MPPGRRTVGFGLVEELHVTRDDQEHDLGSDDDDMDRPSFIGSGPRMTTITSGHSAGAIESKPSTASQATVAGRVTNWYHKFSMNFQRRDTRISEAAFLEDAKKKSWLKQLIDGTCYRRFTNEAKKQKELAKNGFDQKTGKKHPYPRLRTIVKSKGFEVWLTTTIILNCIYVGWQAELPREDMKSPEVKDIEQALEYLFCLSFLFELVCRILCEGWTYLFLPENNLDVFLVVLSTLLTFLNLFNFQSSGTNVLRKLTVLRTLRLIRLARSVRLRPEFKEMWRLLRGITDSFETLFWTYIMIGCVLYFFAIMATVLIAKSGTFRDASRNEASSIAQEHFGNVLQAMLTLFQVMTLDSWTSIMRPLMKEEWWIAAFFIIFICVADLVLLNLVTAVIVENAFSAAQDDEDELAAQLDTEKEKELDALRDFFRTLDEDDNGCVTLAELEKAKSKPRVRAILRMFDIKPQDIVALFAILDTDQSGELEAEEFIMGIRRLKGEAKAKDIMRLNHEYVILERSVARLDNLSRQGMDRLRELQKHLSRTSSDLTALKRNMVRAKEAVTAASRTQRVPTPPQTPKGKRRQAQVSRGSSNRRTSS
mmetsp:Transcript_6279/g.15041  ORF Transcript_6279/g.15041 Transcript_6279/m.15041 type:complete len:595 (-) Transcript_6279:71-1855(-)